MLSYVKQERIYSFLFNITEHETFCTNNMKMPTYVGIFIFHYENMPIQIYWKSDH